MSNNRNSNQFVVPGAKKAQNQTKNEIASDFGVRTEQDADGSNGGEITKRLVQQAQEQIGERKSK